MPWLSTLPTRLRALFRKRQLDAEMDAEMRSHLELRTQANLEAGMSPEEARFAALRQFGWRESIKEECRDQRGVRWLETLLQDIRYGARQLRKSPGFTAVAVLTLALGIGATTSVFSVVNAVLLAPLPYESPERLVQVWTRFAGIGLPRDENHVSAPEFRDLATLSHSFSHVGAYASASFNLSGGPTAERIEGAEVSPALLSLLGARPMLGRLFADDEAEPGRNRLVLLSHGLWQRRFGGDPNLLGQSLRLNGESHTIVGVMPPTFRFPDQAELCAPLAFRPEELASSERGNHRLRVLARLKPEVSVDRARAEMDALSQGVIEQNPDYPYRKYNFGIVLRPLLDETVGEARTILWVLMGAVILVLLIACTNIANLLLVRASTRGPELALRSALGADRRRLMSQLLTESVLLAGLSGVAGLLLGYGGTQALAHLAADKLPRVAEVAVSGRVLMFTTLVTLATGLLFGLVPALQTTGARFDRLRSGVRGFTADASLHRVRQGFVVGQVALSVTLLIGAGLLVRSFSKLLTVDPGFHAPQVLTMNVSLLGDRYAEAEQARGFFRDVLEQIRGLPGVEAAGAVSGLPLTGQGSSGTVTIETQSVPPDRASPDADLRAATPGYFEAMGISLVRGRLFDSLDSEGAAPAAIIDETLAEAFWPGEDPIGRRLRHGLPESATPWMTVVGVVRHVRNRTLEAPSRVQVYWPHAQDPWRSASLVVRTTGDPRALVSAVRQQVAARDPDQPVYRIRTMQSILAGALAQRGVALLLIGLLAGIAGLLAAMGLYGVVAYTVSQRMQEFGIRLALGADRMGLVGLILGRGLTLTAIGSGLGLAATFPLRRTVESLLYGVGPYDPVTMAGVLLLLLGVSLLACWLPARRTASADPMVVLRNE